MAPERPQGEPPELDGQLFEATGEVHANADALEQTLRSLLAVYPQASVGAMTSAGIYVPMPESVGLGEHQVLEGRSGLDLIGTEDREAVLENWDRALNFGASRCTISPEGDGEVILYALDLRERHGVVFTLLASSDPLAAAEPVASEPVVQRPRFATIHKNELSFLVHVDEAIQQILGWEAQEMLGHRSLEFVHPDDHALAIDNWMQMLARPGPARRVRQRLQSQGRRLGLVRGHQPQPARRPRPRKSSSARWSTSPRRWPRTRTCAPASSCWTASPKPCRSG